MRGSGEFIGADKTSKTQKAIKKEKENLAHNEQASLKCRKILLTFFVWTHIELSLVKKGSVSLPNIHTSTHDKMYLFGWAGKEYSESLGLFIQQIFIDSPVCARYCASQKSYSDEQKHRHCPLQNMSRKEEGNTSSDTQIIKYWKQLKCYGMRRYIVLEDEVLDKIRIKCSGGMDQELPWRCDTWTESWRMSWNSVRARVLRQDVLCMVHCRKQKKTAWL